MSMNLDDMDGGTGQRLGRQPGHSDIEARRERFDPGFNLDSVSYITHDTSISENIRLCVSDDNMMFTGSETGQPSSGSTFRAATVSGRPVVRNLSARIRQAMAHDK